MKWWRKAQRAKESSGGPEAHPPALTVHQAVFLNGLVLKELKKMADDFETEMGALRDDQAAQMKLIQQVVQGQQDLQGQLAAALAKVQPGTVLTDAQVQEMATLRQSFEANTAVLANLVQPGSETGPDAPGATVQGGGAVGGT